MHIDIRCPNCFVEIDSKNLNVQNEKAKCQECSTEFSIAKTVQTKLRNKVQINQPNRFNILKVGNQELDIQFTFQVKGTISTFLGLLFASKGSFIIPFFITLIFFASFMVNFPGMPNYVWLLILALLLFVVLQLYRIKTGIQQSINIKNGTLKIINPTLNLRKKLSSKLESFIPETTIEIEASNIDQIYIKETNSDKGKILDLFILQFKMKDGIEINPIMPLFELQEALYIEQEIEQFLNISDRKMENEFKT